MQRTPADACVSPPVGRHTTSGKRARPPPGVFPDQRGRTTFCNGRRPFSILRLAPAAHARHARRRGGNVVPTPSSLIHPTLHPPLTLTSGSGRGEHRISRSIWASSVAVCAASGGGGGVAITPLRRAATGTEEGSKRRHAATAPRPALKGRGRAQAQKNAARQRRAVRELRQGKRASRDGGALPGPACLSAVAVAVPRAREGGATRALFF